MAEGTIPNELAWKVLGTIDTDNQTVDFPTSAREIIFDCKCISDGAEITAPLVFPPVQDVYMTMTMSKLVSSAPAIAHHITIRTNTTQNRFSVTRTDIANNDWEVKIYYR